MDELDLRARCANSDEASVGVTLRRLRALVHFPDFSCALSNQGLSDSPAKILVYPITSQFDIQILSQPRDKTRFLSRFSFFHNKNIPPTEVF